MNQDSDSQGAGSIQQFAIKAAIVFAFFMVVTGYTFHKIQSMGMTAKPKEKNRVLLMSFIQNPAALYKVSLIDEKDGNLEYAITDLEMAVGLLEMHRAEPQVIERYSKRLKQLEEFKRQKEIH